MVIEKYDDHLYITTSMTPVTKHTPHHLMKAKQLSLKDVITYDEYKQ